MAQGGCCVSEPECAADVAARTIAVARRIRSGTFSINGGNYFAPGAPFGGYKQSGTGREMGVAGLEESLERKTFGAVVAGDMA